MKNVFASKVSYFILTLFFVVIIASFLFSGNVDFFSTGSSGQEIASVNGKPISFREFQTALSNQIQFFNKMMGGNGLTEKQLEQMGIKQSVLNGLIEQKLLLNLAEDSHIEVSLDEIKSEIKKLPYFKTNNQFDVNLYKNLLYSNKLTPNQFEDMISNDLKNKKINQVFTSLLMSKNHVKDVLKFKNQKLKVTGVKISRQSLTPLIDVSQDEIESFIKNPENKSRLESAYNEKSAQYNKPEEILARHILIRGNDEKSMQKIKEIKQQVNPQNFSQIATKTTEDESGKSNGGSLGWFSRGRMVPEFEKVAFNLRKGEISEPVKTQFGYHLILVENKKAAESTPLKNVEADLAREELQKTKSKELATILISTQEKIKNHLMQNQVTSLNSLMNKVDGDFFKDVSFNFYDQKINSTSFTPKEIQKLFRSQKDEILDFGNPGTIFLVKVLSKELSSSFTSEEINKEFESLSANYSNQVRNELIKNLNNKAKIVTNQRLL